MSDSKTAGVKIKNSQDFILRKQKCYGAMRRFVEDTQIFVSKLEDDKSTKKFQTLKNLLEEWDKVSDSLFNTVEQVEANAKAEKQSKLESKIATQLQERMK